MVEFGMRDWQVQVLAIGGDLVCGRAGMKDRYLEGVNVLERCTRFTCELLNCSEFGKKAWTEAVGQIRC